MELPILLPAHLQALAKIERESELLKRLAEEPRDLILFFEQALKDELWSAGHRPLIKKLFCWLTRQFSQGRLAIEAAERTYRAVHAHPESVKGLIPRDLIVEVEGFSRPVNSLLLGMSSTLLLNLLRREGRRHKTKTIHLQGGSKESLEAAIEFIQSGDVKNLWMKDFEALLAVMEDASEWEMKGLDAFCTSLAGRYLDEGNVIHVLKKANAKGLEPLKAACIQFVNNHPMGVLFHRSRPGELWMEFLHYRDLPLAIFQELKGEITGLSFHSGLTDDARFREILDQVPLLKRLDISQTLRYTEWLQPFPKRLEELDLSMCEWLDLVLLKQLLQEVPKLKILKINGNDQISYDYWPCLAALSSLEVLKVARCRLDSEVLMLIGKSCPKLLSIDLEGGRNLNDAALIALARALPFLEAVTASRTNISDSAIVELCFRCKELRYLNLAHCPNITNQGVAECAKIARKLKYLDISHAAISPDLLLQVQKLNSALHIES